MYSSDGGTDPSKSDDDDIPISIHSSISSPTVLSQTLLYSIQLPLLLNTRPNSITLHKPSQKPETKTMTQKPPTDELRVYIVLALKVL